VRIQSLREMLTDLRVEARLSANAAHGSHLEPGHISRLRRVQEELYLTPDWKPLQIRDTTKTLSPGQRTIALPERLSQRGLDAVWARPAGTKQWCRLMYGITPDHLSASDSDADERKELIRRFAAYQPSGGEQITSDEIEVWPIPIASTELMFLGEQKLMPLVDPETDYSTIDGPLVVLHTAAELLAGQKSEDTPIVLERARSRFQFIKSQHAALDNRQFNLSGPTPGARAPRRGIDYIES
jgi:hypothetical protein